MQDSIWEIIASKINEEEITPGEETFFQDWIAQSPEHPLLFKQLKKHYFAHRLEQTMNVNEAYRDNFQKIARQKAARRRRRLHYLSAATILFAVAMAYGVFHHTPESRQKQAQITEIHAGDYKAVLTLNSGKQIVLHQKEGVTLQEQGSTISNQDHTLAYSINDSIETTGRAYNELNVPRGGEYRLILADGTKVWLNSDTYLKFPVAFGKDERRIMLTGEAYFEVAHDPLKPFVVESNGVNITVLGTSFNITAYKDYSKVITTLVEGSVQVSCVRELSMKEILTPGKQAVFDRANQTLSIHDVNVNLYTSWKEGYYSFEMERLENIMSTLGRWYDVKVLYESHQIRDMRFTGRVKRYSEITDFLETIKLTHDVEFIINERTVMVINK